MKYTLSIAFILCLLNTNAQVKFENISLDDALVKATASGKIVFAQFVTETCQECNDVADKAFENPELGKTVLQKCIPLKIDVLSKDRAEFLRRFPTATTLGTYFILGSGELIHRYTRTTTLSTAYEKEIITAYDKWQEGLVTLKELDEEWNNNSQNVVAMEKLLDKRFAVNLPTDSLLEVYVKRLPADSFNSKRVLVFLANHAPMVGTKADKILRKNSDFFNMAWYSLPLQQRISINRRIIAKSLQKAIDSKDEIYLKSIAFFQTGTYDNKEAAKKYNDNLYLSYFLGIRDYSKYLQLKVPYVENYYMNYPVSFILQQDSIRKQSMLRNLPGDTLRKDNGFIVKKTLQSFASMGQYYSRELNDGAWVIYARSDNKDLLNKALQWAKRANQFYATAASMDTYARLLYKTGNKKEAIEWEAKAIQQQKELKFGYKQYEEVLGKMNNGEGKIDEYGL